MKNLNKNKCGDAFEFDMYDEPEIPLFLIRNLKIDLEQLFRKYVSFSENNLSVKIKILKTNKYVIDVECMTNFLLSGNNI